MSNRTCTTTSGGMMVSSDPDLRERLVAKIKEKGSIHAETLDDVRRILGEEAESNTRVGRALRSLNYNPAHADQRVRVLRPHAGEMETRPYHISYRAS